MAEGGGEADLFRPAKIGVLWNMDLCPIPPEFSDATQIVPLIKLALSVLGYEGEVHIGGIGDTRKLELNIIRDMRSTGIVLEHSDSDEYPNCTHVMVHIYGWTMRNRGANILYISTDPNSVRYLDTLGSKGFNILRVQHKSPCGDAKQLWDWSDILNVVSQPVEAIPLLNSNGRTDSHRDGGLSLSQCYSVVPNHSVVPNLVGDSGGGADNNRDGKGRDVGPSPSQRSSVNSSGMAGKDRDGLGELAAKNGDGMGEFGEQAREKPTRQPQSGKKRRKSYQLRSKFTCS